MKTVVKLLYEKMLKPCRCHTIEEIAHSCQGDIDYMHKIEKEKYHK